MVRELYKRQLFKGFSTLDNNTETLFDLDLIKRDLLNHFYTRKGERVMYPEFGTIIWDALFDPFTESLKEELTEDVRKVIESDPRVTLNDVYVDEFEHGIVIQANITYTSFSQTEWLAIEFDKRSLEE